MFSRWESRCALGRLPAWRSELFCGVGVGVASDQGARAAAAVDGASRGSAPGSAVCPAGA